MTQTHTIPILLSPKQVIRSENRYKNQHVPVLKVLTEDIGYRSRIHIFFCQTCFNCHTAFMAAKVTACELVDLSLTLLAREREMRRNT